MKTLYIYNFINFSSPIEAVLNFIFKLTTVVSIFAVFYLLFTNLHSINSDYIFQALLLSIFILFLYINPNIINIRYYNQVFIKRKMLILFVLMQIFFSYSFISVSAILLSFTLAGKYPFYYFLQALILYFIIACIITGLKKHLIGNKQIIFLFLGLTVVSFSKNIFIIFFTNIIISGLVIIVLFPLFLYFIHRLIYAEKKMQIFFTFQHILSERKAALKFCIFECLFLFRIKKKLLLLCLSTSIAVFSFILFDFFNNSQPYITRSAAVLRFIGFGFPLITGIFIVTYGQFIFTWSLFYLNDMLLKKISIKNLLLGKLFFLIFSVFIIYAITFPFILELGIMPIEYTASALFNAFILSLITLTISTLNLSKVNASINPTKYKEKGLIQSGINIVLQRIYFILYTGLTRFFSSTDILVFTGAVALLCFIFYPIVLSKLETQILNKRYTEVIYGKGMENAK